MSSFTTFAPSRPRRAGRIVLLGIATAALATAGLAEPAAAAKRYAVQLDGGGTHVVTDGTAVVAGTVTGNPFDGSYVTELAADDGSLPVAGECEPATATLVVDGSRDRRIEMSATGRVCGQWLGPTNVVTHVFTGRYLVEGGTVRRLLDTDGFFEVRLAVTGDAHVFAIST